MSLWVNDCLSLEYSENIWHLFARGLNRELSPGELQELNDLLANDPALAQQYELLTRIWTGHSQQLPDDSAASVSISKIISRAENENHQPETQAGPVPQGRRIFRLLYPLAAVAILLTAVWFFRRPETVSLPAKHTPEALVTQNGSRSRFLLPDGTVVWLNAGSKLSLENDFTGNTREVRLDGEAYFNVTKNQAKPFIVHTTGINIKVLGTVFNVKAYAEDTNIETTLLSGSVKVFREQGDEDHAIHLEKNQKLVIARQERALPSPGLKSPAGTAAALDFQVEPIDTLRGEKERYETAWLYSRLVFRGDDFGQLAAKMERWYNIKIVFTDEQVKKLHFNGSFETETPEQALFALKAALPLFVYSVKNQQVTIGSSR